MHERAYQPLRFRQATALLLTVRNEGTDWMEAHLPPHVEVFYRVQDIKPSRFKLILCVSPKSPTSRKCL